MTSAVKAASSVCPTGALRCVERCWPRTRQANRSDTLSIVVTCSTQALRRAGLGCFFRSFLEDQLLKREVRDSLVQSLVFLSKLLEPFDLVQLQPAELLALAIIGEWRHLDRAHGLSNAAPLGQQNANLPQFGTTCQRCFEDAAGED